MQKFGVCVLFVFLSTACTNINKKPLPKFTEVCHDLGATLGETRYDVVKKLGKPKRIRTQEMPNHYDRKKNNTFVWLEYKNFTVTLVEVPHLRKSHLTSVTFHGKNPNFFGTASFVKNRAEFLDAWPKPNEQNKDELTYHCNQPEFEVINVELENDTASRVIWQRTVE